MIGRKLVFERVPVELAKKILEKGEKQKKNKGPKAVVVKSSPK